MQSGTLYYRPRITYKKISLETKNEPRTLVFIIIINFSLLFGIMILYLHVTGELEATFGDLEMAALEHTEFVIGILLVGWLVVYNSVSQYVYNSFEYVPLTTEGTVNENLSDESTNSIEYPELSELQPVINHESPRRYDIKLKIMQQNDVAHKIFAVRTCDDVGEEVRMIGICPKSSYDSE